MYNKILVPLDGSALSEEVLPLVRTLAEMSKGQIILLRVAEYPNSLYLPYYEYPLYDPDAVKAIAKNKTALSHELSDYLERIVSTMKAGGLTVNAEICDGPVVDTILECINRHQVDLVVLSTYGQSGSTRTTIGAVANRVLHESQVPVILVRPAGSSSIHHPYRVSSKRSKMDLASPDHFGPENKDVSVTGSRHFGSDHLPTGA